MTSPADERETGCTPAYVMPLYWQCMKCLWVTHDPNLTVPSERRCACCNSQANQVYTWPGSAGEVYHAVLYDFRDRDDWVAAVVRAVTLCSLAEVHEGRLIWTILARRGCPGSLAQAIEKGIKRQDYLALFERMVGKKAKHFRPCDASNQFWPHLQSLREFRNEVVHGEPEQPHREPGDIPADVGCLIQTVKDGIEPAFQELTDKALEHIASEA